MSLLGVLFAAHVAFPETPGRTFFRLTRRVRNRAPGLPRIHLQPHPPTALPLLNRGAARGIVSPMPALALTLPLEVLVACASLLVLQIYVLGMYIGALRGFAGLVVNPEDGGGARTLMTTEPARVARANRAHRNAVENIPGFLILATLATWVGCAPVALAFALITFTVARFAHTLCYLRALQPWRSVSHGAASACQLVVIVLLALRVFF
jgi:prostaglandin-E synthase 1